MVTAGSGQPRRRSARMADGYTVKSWDDFEVMEGSGGCTWHLARKSLGADAFGFNIVEIEPGGELPAHNESESNQEEVFAVLEGEGTIVADDTEHPAPARHLRPLRPRGQAHDPKQVRRQDSHPADRGARGLGLQAAPLGLSRASAAFQTPPAGAGPRPVEEFRGTRISRRRCPRCHCRRRPRLDALLDLFRSLRVLGSHSGLRGMLLMLSIDAHLALLDRALIGHSCPDTRRRAPENRAR